MGHEGVGLAVRSAAAEPAAEPSGLDTSSIAAVLDGHEVVAASASRAAPLDELLHVVARQACRLVGVTRASIYLREDGTGRFRGRVGETFTDVDHDSAVRRLVAGLDADAFTREIVVSGRPVVIGDAAADPRPVRATLRAWDVRAILGVPMIAGGEAIGLIFLDDAAVCHRFTERDADLAALFANLVAPAVEQARHADRLRSVASSAARQNEMLRRVGLLEEHLAGLLADAASLGDAAEAVAATLGEPCFLHDADMRRVAAAGLAGGRAQLRSVLDFDVDRRCVAETLALVGAKPAVLAGPFPRFGVHRRYLVASIRSRGATGGYLVVPEASRRLGAVELTVVRRAAAMIALGVGGRGGDVRAEALAREQLTRDLLAGTGADAAFEQRAALCGFPLTGQHVVARLRRVEGEPAPIDLREVEDAFVAAGCAHPFCAAPHDDGDLSVLLAIDGDVPRVDAARQARAWVEAVMARIGTPGAIAAALSSACCAPDEFAAGNDEAAQVLDCLLSVGTTDGPSLLCADDLGPGRLILTTLDHVGARRFARQTFGSLIDGDGAVFLQTLAVYFDCCRSVRRAALVMGVHENTVRYRLSRLAAISGLDIDGDPDDHLSSQLAILILRLQGRLAAAVAEPPAAADEPLLRASA